MESDYQHGIISDREVEVSRIWDVVIYSYLVYKQQFTETLSASGPIRCRFGTPLAKEFQTANETSDLWECGT